MGMIYVVAYVVAYVVKYHETRAQILSYILNIDCSSVFHVEHS